MATVKLGILCLLSVSLFSCSLRFGDPQPEPVSLQAQLQGQDCLEGAGPILDRFFSGRSSNQEIDRFWGCLNQALASFSSHVDGRSQESYRPEELAAFVSRFFLANREVPSELLRSLMILKQALFSGSATEISKSELSEIGRMFGAFATASKILLPHMPITPEFLKERAAKGENVEPAILAIKESSAVLLTAFDGRLGNYALSDFEQLLRHTSRFFSSNGWNNSWIETPISYWSLLGPLKALLVSPPEDRILPDDWRIFVSVLPSYYSLYLRYDLDINAGFSLLQGEKLLKLVSLLDELIPLLESSLNRRSDKLVKAEEIRNLLEEFRKRGWLPWPVKDSTELLNLALRRFLPDPASKGRLQISAVNLRELRNLYVYFTEGVRALEGGFRRELGHRNWETGTITRQRANSLFRSAGSRDTVFNNEITKVALRDLLRNLNEVNLAYSGPQKMVVIPNASEIRASFPHLQRLHYLRTANRILLRAYGNQRSGTITAAQTKTILREISPILNMLGVNAATLIRATDARFFEASLFLPSSDGKESLTMTEALELESLLLSVLAEAPNIHREIQRQCRSRGETIGATVSASCFRLAFAHRIQWTWRGAPALAAVIAGMHQRDREEILEKIDGFLRKDRWGKPYDQNDTQSLLQIPYYMELLFFRYDKNRDNWISETEAKLAFPLFRSLIAQKAAELGRTDPAEHYKIFTYILARRKVPESLLEKLDYLNWQPETPYAIDRVGIIAVFSTLLK
jgi:hypothetical protein